jgi:hypothetical protein
MIDIRKSPRVQEKANVTVRVQSSPEVPELEGRVFSCHSTDVSLEGIKMHIDTDLPVGALLELEIIFSNSPERYWQIGNVIWCDEWVDYSSDKENWHNIGIRFDTAENLQISSWQSGVSKLIEKSKEY